MPRTVLAHPLEELPPTVAAALAPFLGIADGPDFRADAFAAADRKVDAAWHELLAAERENPLLDLRRPMQIRAVLKRALAARDDIPNAHERLVVAAALYFAEVDDGSNDLVNAWGFDDDQVVVDAVIAYLNQRGSTLAMTKDIFRAPRRGRTRRSRLAKRTLPKVGTAVRSAVDSLPPDLAELLREGAARAVEAVRALGVDTVVADLRARAELHLANARREEGAGRITNLRTAGVVAAELSDLLTAHASASKLNDQVLPLIIAAGEVFVRDEDGDPDFGSSFGFDDDLRVLRAVQRLILTLTPPAPTVAP